MANTTLSKDEILDAIGAMSVIDLSELGRLIREKVIDLVDHKNIDLDVAFMK